MIIVLAPCARRIDADEIIRQIAEVGLKPLYLPGVERTVIGALGDERILASLHFENNPVVERVTPFLKQHSHLPVLVDPSHGTGLRELVLPMSRAAIGAGADGLMIEVHPDPKSALSDGRQSLAPPDFDALMRAIRPFVAAVGKIPSRKSPARARPTRASMQTKRRPHS